MNQEDLKKILRYDPDTGLFTWLVRRTRGVKPGDVAGYSRRDGYRIICIYGDDYYAHRLAALWMTGEWPSDEIDHIDGDPGNNRWCNLRAASSSLNKQNQRRARRDNKTALLGVYPVGGKFRSAIKAGKRRVYFGPFQSAGEAHAAYLAAKRALHDGCTI